MPPELAQKAFFGAVLGLLAVAGVGWWGLGALRAASAPPTVKIGLVAPFEGVYRGTGYEVLFAVKQAIAERNRGEGLNGFRVELVALNDFNEPAEAARQARALVADPGLVGVVGHFSPETTEAALPVYQQAGVAVVSPWSVRQATLADFSNLVSVAASVEETEARLEAEIGRHGVERVQELAAVGNAVAANTQAIVLAVDAVTAGEILRSLPPDTAALPRFGQVETGNRQLVQIAGPAADGLIYVSPGPAATELTGAEMFIEGYQALAGFPPGPRAILAYDATQVLLDSVAETIKISDKWYNDRPKRDSVWQTLTAGTRQPGITGQIEFDQTGQRLNAPLWLYKISEVEYPGSLIDR